MRSVSFWLVWLLVVSGFILACSQGLHVIVLYDRAGGLESGDAVFWKEESIGKVESVEAKSEGSWAVHLRIREEFRQAVTDQCRFFVQDDPQQQGRKAVEMVRLSEGGKPLTDGAVVKGSSSLSLLLESGNRELQAWARLLQEELERWEEELRRLPEREWYRHLERQMEQFAREMEDAGEQARRYFREEVLPRLEESVRELKKRLLEQDMEEDAGVLEVKLQELQHI
ncbi:MAG: hypothetical protein ACLFVT_09925 [Syntrophobacteria bacterium]